MNRRENFSAVVNRQNPGWVPIDLGRHVGSIHRLSYLKLRDYLGDPSLRNEDKILDRMVQNVIPDEKLLQQFGVDFRWLIPNWVGVREVSQDTYADMWGIHWQYMLDAYSVSYSPLSQATIADLDRFDWPDPYNPALFAGLRDQAKYWYEQTDYVLAADSIKGGILTKAFQIRGYEQMFMDMINNVAFAEALMDKLLWLYKEMWMQFLKEVAPYVQLVYFTDDIGGQSAMLISPDTFRRLVKPRLKALIDHIKGQADVRFMYHTDGTLVDVIEDVIEMGVDILNPVQTSAMGMDTYVLKERYGDRLCFHGAIDVQQVLPSATPEEVRYDVAKRIYDLGRGGGYILSPCHNIGSDVPPQNVVAMFEAAREYGRYPLQLDSILRPEDLQTQAVAASPSADQTGAGKPARRPRPRR